MADRRDFSRHKQREAITVDMRVTGGALVQVARVDGQPGTDAVREEWHSIELTPADVRRLRIVLASPPRD